MLENPERLVAVGPMNPATGFPLWYKDATGTLLDQALSTADPNTPAVGDPQPFVSSRPGAPASLPDESFYWLAEARMVTGGGVRRGRARVVLALEATFAGTGAVADGQQIVFARVRFRIDDGVPGGSYVITHPFGQTDPLVADDRGRVFETEDIGVAPLQFDGALSGHVAPFLRWTSGAEKLPNEADPPAGYLGDGDTAHTITGSPFTTNFVRIEGPNISEGNGPRDPLDPGNPNKAFTKLFTVQGRQATVLGVTLDRATYARDAAGAVTLDVFARTEAGQLLTANGPGLPVDLPLSANGGSYYARADVAAVPASVTVTNTSDNPPSNSTVSVTDAVLISQADYDPATQTLTVDAVSSDVSGAPTLTVSGTDLVDSPPGDISGIAAPPATITVTSSLGGRTSRAVTGVG
jgi:hypothetical protein